MGSLPGDMLDNCMGAAPANAHLNPLDPDEFRRQGHMIIDFLADYYRGVHNYPVRSQVEPGYLRKLLPESAPNGPESIESILGDIQSCIVPGITHWQSPNYFAYFPSSGSTAGFLGEMLSTGFNVVGFNWMSSPAATELETIVMDWFGKMLKLPSSFLSSSGGGGVLQGTTCMARSPAWVCSCTSCQAAWTWCSSVKLAPTANQIMYTPLTIACVMYAFPDEFIDSNNLLLSSFASSSVDEP